jgi:hypothetical protein
MSPFDHLGSSNRLAFCTSGYIVLWDKKWDDYTFNQQILKGLEFPTAQLLLPSTSRRYPALWFSTFREVLSHPSTIVSDVIGRYVRESQLHTRSITNLLQIYMMLFPSFSAKYGSRVPVEE